jgi:hypothetical protein
MTSHEPKTNLVGISGVLLFLLFVVSALGQSIKREPIITNLPAMPTFSPSTVPPNGDQNPYGIAFVPHNFMVTWCIACW